MTLPLTVTWRTSWVIIQCCTVWASLTLLKQSLISLFIFLFLFIAVSELRVTVMLCCFERWWGILVVDQYDCVQPLKQQYQMHAFEALHSDWFDFSSSGFKAYCHTDEDVHWDKASDWGDESLVLEAIWLLCSNSGCEEPPWFSDWWIEDISSERLDRALSLLCVILMSKRVKVRTIQAHRGS